MAPGDCVAFENRDDMTYVIQVDGDPATLPPGAAEVCFTDTGVHRVRTTDAPYAGGFVIVDEFA